PPHRLYSYRLLPARAITSREQENISSHYYRRCHSGDRNSVCVRTKSRRRLRALSLTYRVALIDIRDRVPAGRHRRMEESQVHPWCGAKLLTVSFVAYSGYQFFYILMIVFDTGSEQAMLPGSRGLINLMMIAIMSMSMVMWLLEDEREKLRQVNKDLDSFLHSTSHDLRAPITSILGLTYLGKVELTEEKGRNYMELIEQRAQKLNMILTDVLRLSKTKKLGIKLQTIRFSDLVNDVVSDIEFLKGTSRIRLDYEKNSDSSFYSDPAQISIILSNLITNAVKYHRLNQDDPYIRIAFKRISDTVIFSVEDNGQGIPAHSVNKVFEMFF